MATESFTRVLADCVEALQEGGKTLEDCLERYPQYREQLQPLLETAQALSGHQPKAQPSPHFIVDLKEMLKRSPRKGGEANQRK